jgi:hypothetical protein
VWVAKPGEMVVFDGAYSEYVTARDGSGAVASEDGPSSGEALAERADIRDVNGTPRAAKQQDAGASNGNGKRRARLSPYKRAQRAASLEERIEALEVRLVDLSGAIGEASAAGDAGSVHDLGQQYIQAEADLEAAMLEWEDLLAQD